MSYNPHDSQKNTGRTQSEQPKYTDPLKSSKSQGNDADQRGDNPDEVELNKEDEPNVPSSNRSYPSKSNTGNL